MATNIAHTSGNIFFHTDLNLPYRWYIIPTIFRQKGLLSLLPESSSGPDRTTNCLIERNYSRICNKAWNPYIRGMHRGHINVLLPYFWLYGSIAGKLSPVDAEQRCEINNAPPADQTFLGVRNCWKNGLHNTISHHIYFNVLSIAICNRFKALRCCADKIKYVGIEKENYR